MEKFIYWIKRTLHHSKHCNSLCIRCLDCTSYILSDIKKSCNTLNGDSYINKCSKENNQVVSEKIEGVYVSKLLCSKDMLFAFATTKYGKEMNSYIYIYDAEELSFDEKIDITNYGGTHYKAILFDNNILFSNSVDSGDHPCNTVCIYSINDKTIETISFDQYYMMYSRDASKKVRSARTTLAKAGKFIGPQAPYGYKRWNVDDFLQVK